VLSIQLIGRDVLVVNGAYRGYKAKLEEVNVDDYSVSVTIEQGPSRGRLVEGIAYEDVSKICTKSFPFAY
jgi:DNA/RNA-binding protein KIN17